jgi:hypothetical protein
LVDHQNTVFKQVTAADHSAGLNQRQLAEGLFWKRRKHAPTEFKLVHLGGCKSAFRSEPEIQEQT